MRFRGYQVQTISLLASHGLDLSSFHPTIAQHCPPHVGNAVLCHGLTCQGSNILSQVHWLTLGANLVNSSAQLFLQLPEIETVAYQTNITVSHHVQPAHTARPIAVNERLSTWDSVMAGKRSHTVGRRPLQELGFRVWLHACAVPVSTQTTAILRHSSSTAAMASARELLQTLARCQQAAVPSPQHPSRTAVDARSCRHNDARSTLTAEEAVRAQLAGTGLATSPAPFTVAEQTAVLTLVQNLLPPLFLGLGPQWARIQGYQSNVSSNTTQLSLLFDSILPPVWNDTDDTFPEVRPPDRPMRAAANLPN